MIFFCFSGIKETNPNKGRGTLTRFESTSASPGTEGRGTLTRFESSAPNTLINDELTTGKNLLTILPYFQIKLETSTKNKHVQILKKRKMGRNIFFIRI